MLIYSLPAEDVFQSFHEFAFRLTGIFDGIFAHWLVFVRHFVFQDGTGDNQSIIREDAVDVIVTFQRIGCFVALEEVYSTLRTSSPQEV